MAIGYQIFVYGGLTNNSTSPDGTFLYYPTADYFVDGRLGELLDTVCPLARNLFDVVLQLVPKYLTSLLMESSTSSGIRHLEMIFTQSTSQ